jgi:predicted phage terminase large subunit-like protein
MIELPFALHNAMLRADMTMFVRRVMETLEPGTQYEHNWHVELLCNRLELVRSGDIRRLMINLPPRSMKTIVVSVAFSAWELGHDPSRRIMCVAYSADVAKAQAVLFNRVVTSNWFRSLFPKCRPVVPNRQLEWATSAGGYRLATSIDGSVLGRGADIIILDDPNKGQEIYSKVAREKVKTSYDQTISTRLNHPKESAIICVMQRLHDDDLAGHMMRQEPFELVRVPVVATADETWDIGHGLTHARIAGEFIQPSRMGAAEIALQRAKMGDTAFNAQYQQQPIPEDGIVIRRGWLRYYEEPRDDYLYRLASWDTASTLSENADWSVGTVWGVADCEIHLLHVERVRMESPELVQRIEEIHRRWQVDQTVIEDGDLGRGIAQHIRRSSEVCRPKLYKPKVEKLARMQARAVMFETGKVFLPRQASWLSTYLDELLGFPNCTHDDQVDSTSQALDEIQWRFSAEITPEKRNFQSTRPIRRRAQGRKR